MNTYKTIVLFFILANLSSFGQANDYYLENVKRIDACINGPIKVYNCEEGMMFPAKYKRSKLNADRTIVSFINRLFDENTIKPDVEKTLSKVRKKSMRLTESVNGLIESDDITILGRYLWVNIKFDFIEDVLIRSKVTLKTTTHGKCGSYTNLLDYKLIKDFIIKDAKVLFEIGYDYYITSDTIYSDNLNALAEKQKDYKFSIPGSSTEDWVNEIFTKQYQTDETGAYNYSQAPKDFVRLIKENKIETIKDLLFSPSYTTCVNAMEALIYLSSVNRAQLTAKMNDKITQIKNGTFIIMQQGSPDVFYTRKGYRELQTTDERVIKKYKASI
jgi:hypothetical protein